MDSGSSATAHRSGATRSLVAVLSTVGLAATVFGGVPRSPAASAVEPVAPLVVGAADDPTLFAACGRVFSDPHAYWPSPTAAAGESPWAKGNAICRSTDFVGYDDMVSGMEYLESLYPDFVDFQKLEEDYGSGQDCATTTDANAMCSAGLPTIGVDGLQRTRSDLYMVRLTDERVPDTDKKRFSFPLSIHGIERAGAEAGVRIAEDLAVWGYCEAVANGTLAANGETNCAQEGAIPHPLMETLESTVTAGDALARSEIYLVFANPDGWRRGDQGNVPRSFQRYNGNGVDMNRDWPTEGYTFRPYTPWSEPETKAFGEAMKSIADTWDGGIDLHGQNEAQAFSFTMMGASQRDFAKNQRILQTVKGAYEDAENRLAWSPLIKSNDADEADPRLYGVQWGTVWDTIDYTVTGSLGDWIDSPIGLNADGIDNEMSFSHLYNCGTGTCYVANNEQLHVDGNKSLVYAMVNFTLLPEDTSFDVPGAKVGYVLDDTILSDGGASPPPSYVGFPQQAPIEDVSLDITNNWTYAFEILGPDDDVYNGGVTGTATTVNLGGVSGGSLNSLILERYRGAEDDPPTISSGCDSDDDWETVNEYFNQSIIYAQGGQAVHANAPLPGIWRICLTGDETNFVSSTTADLDISFTAEAAWADPGQVAYDDVTNMNFFAELAPYVTGAELEAIDPDALLGGSIDLAQYRSIVIADDPFPGFSEPVPTGPAQPNFDPVVGAGAGTAPCAYQRGDTDVPPGSNTPQPGCYVSYEFDILASYNNQKFTATLDTANEGLNDWDLYVDRIDPESGVWFEAGRSATGTGDESVALSNPQPGHYRALVVNWSAAEPPVTQTLTRTFSNVYEGPPVGVSQRTVAERDAWGAALLEYVEDGGNLVLTDGALQNLGFMGLIPSSSISSTSVYAGFIGFTTDGNNETYGDPLAANVNQPGAAEGQNHRHQTYEPVPIGFAIQDDTGNDANNSPVWTVDKQTWEAEGGRTVGITGGGRTSLGELAAGDGVVRIIGPLLPMPSQQHYHPYGLADYALTYTGYQVLHNALQWTQGNQAPVAMDDEATVAPGGTVNIDVTANDSDPDNSPASLTVSIESDPADGDAVVEADGSITYTHSGSTGTSDSFVYRLTDPSGAWSTATVSITVRESGDTCRNDLCADDDEPAELTLTFVGGDCSDSANSQGGKSECEDFADGASGSVFIRATNKDDAEYDNAKVYFAGDVDEGDSFVMSAEAAGEDDFGSKVFIHVFASEGGELLQTVEIHTSCSVPLVEGEQFGSLTLGEPGTDPSDPVCTAGEGRVHGSGYWKRETTDKYDKVDFSFDAKVYKGGLKGKLKIHDKAADLKIDAKSITSLSSGEGVDCNGTTLDGVNSFVFTAVGEWELGDTEGTGSFFACGEDNGKNKTPPVDALYVRCEAGCTFDSGVRTGGNDIDGGNIHLHDPIVDPVTDDSSDASASSDDAAEPAADGEAGGDSAEGNEGAGEAEVVELDPILFGYALEGTPVLLTAIVEGSYALLDGSTVELVWVAADGSINHSYALTNTVGVATFVVPMPADGAEFTAVVDGVESNGVRISAGLP